MLLIEFSYFTIRSLKPAHGEIFNDQKSRVIPFGYHPPSYHMRRAGVNPTKYGQKSPI